MSVMLFLFFLNHSVSAQLFNSTETLRKKVQTCQFAQQAASPPSLSPGNRGQSAARSCHSSISNPSRLGEIGDEITETLTLQSHRSLDQTGAQMLIAALSEHRAKVRFRTARAGGNEHKICASSTDQYLKEFCSKPSKNFGGAYLFNEGMIELRIQKVKVQLYERDLKAKVADWSRQPANKGKRPPMTEQDLKASHWSAADRDIAVEFIRLKQIKERFNLLKKHVYQSPGLSRAKAWHKMVDKVINGQGHTVTEKDTQSLANEIVTMGESEIKSLTERIEALRQIPQQTGVTVSDINFRSRIHKEFNDLIRQDPAIVLRTMLESPQSLPHTCQLLNFFAKDATAFQQQQGILLRTLDIVIKAIDPLATASEVATLATPAAAIPAAGLNAVALSAKGLRMALTAEDLNQRENDNLKRFLRGDPTLLIGTMDQRIRSQNLSEQITTLASDAVLSRSRVTSLTNEAASQLRPQDPAPDPSNKSDIAKAISYFENIDESPSLGSAAPATYYPRSEIYSLLDKGLSDTAAVEQLIGKRVPYVPREVIRSRKQSVSGSSAIPSD